MTAKKAISTTRQLSLCNVIFWVLFLLDFWFCFLEQLSFRRMKDFIEFSRKWWILGWKLCYVYSLHFYDYILNFTLLGNIRSADWCQFNKTLFQSNVLTQKHGENLILFKSIIEQEVIIEMSKDLKLNWLLIVNRQFKSLYLFIIFEFKQITVELSVLESLKIETLTLFVPK